MVLVVAGVGAGWLVCVGGLLVLVVGLLMLASFLSVLWLAPVGVAVLSMVVVDLVVLVPGSLLLLVLGLVVVVVGVVQRLL